MKKQTMRRVNELAILNEIYNHQNISRSEISRIVGLNKVTVSDILKNLINSSLVLEVGEGESSDIGGRKPVLLQINPQYAYTVSIDFGYQFIAYMYNYIDGQTIKYAHINTPMETPQQRQEIVKEIIEQSTSVPSVKGLAGISISVHGIVHHHHVLYSPHVDMQGIDLYDYLTDAFHVPVMLENEANLCAIYERDFAATDERTTNLVTLSIHHGLGAGIIVDNRLYRGVNGEAGEVGHTTATVASDGTETSYEEICTQTALFRDVEKACGIKDLSTAKLHQLLADHDPSAEKTIARFREYLLILIKNMILIFSPIAVILNADIIAEIPELLQGFPDEIETVSGQSTSIRLSNNPYTPTLLGGAAVITRHVLGLRREEMHFQETQAEDTEFAQ